LKVMYAQYCTPNAPRQILAGAGVRGGDAGRLRAVQVLHAGRPGPVRAVVGRASIDDWLGDPATDPQLKARLEKALLIRKLRGQGTRITDCP